MKDPLSDNIVLISILATLIFVFLLIFSVKQNHPEFAPSIEWREIPQTSSQTIKI